VDKPQGYLIAAVLVLATRPRGLHRGDRDPDDLKPAGEQFDRPRQDAAARTLRSGELCARFCWNQTTRRAHSSTENRCDATAQLSAKLGIIPPDSARLVGTLRRS
jgi:hypothetical protein